MTIYLINKDGEIIVITTAERDRLLSLGLIAPAGIVGDEPGEYWRVIS